MDRIGGSGGALGIAAVIAAGVLAVGCSPADSQGVETAVSTESDAVRLRNGALARARVWRQPATPIGAVDLRLNPQRPDRVNDDDEIDCRFTPTPVDGTTPKFYCALPSGELVKVKYGRNNPELLAEVAASRLLTALGFMTDHMSIVKRVRCAGCPTFPFQALRCLARIGVQSVCIPGGIDDERIVHFDTVVLERKLAGRIIEAYEDQGWGWFELDRINPAHGGSTLAEVDAFRLMATFLAHWDNKPPNQRLICPPDADRRHGSCVEPLAIIQDLGATFGPLKVDLRNWKRARVWKDARTCTVSMEHLPWGGGTFPERRLSNAGRLLFLRLVEQLSDDQLRGLFEGSRITAQDQFSAEATRADAWVRAFNDRVEQIRTAGPCPS